jgi:hypothetical protein
MSSAPLFFLYLIQVLFTAVLTSSAISNSRVYQSFSSIFIRREVLGRIGSIVSEYPIFILAAKLFMVHELIPFMHEGHWNVVFTFDAFLMLSLWALFLQSVFARHPVYEQTKFYRDSTSTVPPSLFTASFWFRFCNPFWTSNLIRWNENSIL